MHIQLDLKLALISGVQRNIPLQNIETKVQGRNLFLFEGAKLKTTSEDVGRNEEVPKLIKIIAINTK